MVHRTTKTVAQKVVKIEDKHTHTID